MSLNEIHQGTGTINNSRYSNSATKFCMYIIWSLMYVNANKTSNASSNRYK